jgi:hypothetical protein
VDYVLLLVGEDATDASAVEIGGRTGRLADWIAQLRRSGVIRLGGRIDGPGVRVRASDVRPAVVDVPAGVAGAVRSWLLIDTPDLTTALAVARSCPEAAHGDVRVLPVDPDSALLQ